MALTNLAGDLVLWQNIFNMTIIYTFLCKVENFLKTLSTAFQELCFILLISTLRRVVKYNSTSVEISDIHYNSMSLEIFDIEYNGTSVEISDIKYNSMSVEISDRK